jgi:hypothetical protein
MGVDTIYLVNACGLGCDVVDVSSYLSRHYTNCGQ